LQGSLAGMKKWLSLNSDRLAFMQFFFKKTYILILLLGLILINQYSFSQNKEEEALLGRWFTEGYESIVQVYKGANGKYYGKITWLSDTYTAGGKLPKDENNPDVNMKNIPVVGLVVLKDFVYEGNQSFRDGTIYDPKNGKTYSCKAKLTNNGTVFKLRGFIGVSIMGRTTTWLKAK
jgi:uncharacterized protein (DUF2147 family)